MRPRAAEGQHQIQVYIVFGLAITRFGESWDVLKLGKVSKTWLWHSKS